MVPQRSINGPVLFNAYSSTILLVIDIGITVNAFADDHSLQKGFMPHPEQDIPTIKQLESNLVKVENWMSTNRLKLNSSKTEFVMFGSKVQLGKCVSNNITVCGQVMETSKVIQYLGGWFDESLHMNTHVNKKCQTASWNLKLIRMIRSQLDRESCEILTCSLVLSHLDYANGNLFGVHEYML